ncbi:hypothetical protein OS493_036575 [Desmophyllum pertusum]|uniref:Uncharacterized protein n=1 Tax=Desmophyllum pertusum TaxID=174260 RepID=A0A9W9Y7H3_9CNID|nr:hypothetical protein OS493_036575 [Desmophyllum pertusum]
MAQEVMMVKPEEFNRLVQYYKGEISDSALLNKAGRVAAETHLLLQDKTIPDAIVNARVKKLRRERQRLTKRLREVPGVTSLAGGQPPPDVEEDEELKESGAKPKKKKTPTQTPIISREKTPREELLESVRKSAERLAKAREDIERIREKRKETKHKTEAERLKPLPGWEDWAAGRKQRRRLEYDEVED